LKLLLLCTAHRRGVVILYYVCILFKEDMDVTYECTVCRVAFFILQKKAIGAWRTTCMH
jgi:hypothetical protein